MNDALLDRWCKPVRLSGATCNLDKDWCVTVFSATGQMDIQIDQGDCLGFEFPSRNGHSPCSKTSEKSDDPLRDDTSPYKYCIPGKDSRTSTHVKQIWTVENRPSALCAHGLYLLTVSRSARIFSGNIVRLKPRLSGPQWFWLLGLSDPHKPLKCNLYLKNWKTPNHQGITINRSHRVHRKKKVTLKYE